MTGTLHRKAALLTASAASLAAVLALAGCSTGADLDTDAGAEPTSSASAELETLTVANLPIADQGAYFYALDNGIFEEHGLEITAASATGGSAAIAAMAAGDYDIVYSGADGVIKAFANGLPVKIVSGANTNQPEGEKDATGLVVAPGITELSQLNGTSIGTNALGNINQVFAQEFLAENGVTDVQVVEIPFPEQVAALEAGQISATLLPEPFASQAVAGGATILGYPYRIGEDQTTGVGVYVATDDVISEKSDAVSRFVEAMTEASEAANDPANKEAVTDAILANTKLTEEIATALTFVHFTTDVTPAQIQAVADLLVKYEVLPENVEATEIFAAE
jgi:NitT/TauT family transport system substrate-binding protein